MRRVGVLSIALLVLVGAGCADVAGGGGYDDGGGGGYEDRSGGGDLDCDDISGTTLIQDSDPHGLDRDGDGVGCEPYTP